MYNSIIYYYYSITLIHKEPNMNITKYALIVAGGAGKRFGSDIPKQFINLKGKPILMHTIEAFYNADKKTNIILVLPQEQIPNWERLCILHGFAIKHMIVEGGSTRTLSVRKGLAVIEDTESVVAIHDGVRPFVTEKIIDDCYTMAALNGAAIPAVKVVDTIRQIEPATGLSNTLNRNNLVAVQTPQTFRTKEIISAYDQISDDNLTDDASVYEKTGRHITLVEGDIKNMKITHPVDIIVAETILTNG